MTKQSCTEDEFIDLWKRHGSASVMSRVLDVDVANIHRRRRYIERKRGILLAGVDRRSPDFQVTLPENGVRACVDIENGVIVVGSDAHYRKELRSTAHRAMVLAVKELRPKMVVINGDALDGPTIGKHGRIMWEPQPSVKDELEAVTDRLGEIESVAGNAKLHWTWGNHDMRFNSRLSSHASQFEGVKGFSLADHFLRWKFSTSMMVNGHTMIKHRWHLGVHCSYNNVLKSGVSMVCGHTHSLKVVPYNDYGTNARYGVDTGTLAAPDGPQFTYGEDSPANHRSGFAVLTFYRGILMPPELLQVIDEDAGLVSFRGQVVVV
jgi:hypothetical protein